MRRSAHLLMAVRPASFSSAYDMARSVEKLKAAANPAAAGERLHGEVGPSSVRLAFGRASGGGVRCAFVGTWIAEGSVRLEGRFVPAGRTTAFLKATSIVLTTLIVACAWVFIAEVDATTRALVPITTMLAIFAFPFAVVAFGSDREVEEIAIAKAIAAALA